MGTNLRKAAFIDRDGTINKMVHFPDHGILDSPFLPSQVKLMPHAAEGLAALKRKGYLLVLVSNQPGIAKGTMTMEKFRAIEKRLDSLLAKKGASFDAKYYCFHHPEAALAKYRMKCACRKPKPGMMKQAAKDFGVDLRKSYVFGDGIVDVKAGHAAGCKTVFVGAFKPELWAHFAKSKKPDLVAGNLLAAVKKIR